jgi:hypothetical protein
MALSRSGASAPSVFASGSGNNRKALPVAEALSINQGSVSLALQPHNHCSAIHSLGASQTAIGKIVFLLLLIAICIAVSYAGLWVELRNRVVALIRLVRRFNTERSLGHVDC